MIRYLLMYAALLAVCGMGFGLGVYILATTIYSGAC